MEPLSRQLESRADRLADASVEWMYQDPFWEAHYGAERMRRFGSEDARFRVRYLVQALAEQRPSVLEGYAVWLRTLLVSRSELGALTFSQLLSALAAALASNLSDHDEVKVTFAAATRLHEDAS